jgi:three-Cys-motif partner protein
MVALRRPDELPPPTDGWPARPILPHSLDKIHFWGNYLQASSTALCHAFPGVRVCADLFASYGVCELEDGTRSWGTALFSLQVAKPFDLYFFNDIDPECTKILAARARNIGVQGAQVFELDLLADLKLEHTREIADVIVPFGPKVVVATGDANTAQSALKILAPKRRRYICAVIDPQSAIYEWNALAALAFHEKAMDLLVLFPDAMDLGRGLAYYLREGSGQKLDRCFAPGRDWRSVAKASAHPESALRVLYENDMRKLLGFEVGRPQTVVRAGTNLPLYRLVFGSRSRKGIDIWNDICKRKPGEQYELPLLGL